jgi:hypothetical protein
VSRGNLGNACRNIGGRQKERRVERLRAASFKPNQTQGMTEALSNYRLEQVSSIAAVDPAAWNGVAGDDPFSRHEFLVGLEASGCIGPRTAWRPCHMLLRSPDGALAAALPLYLKYDSRGEFVFDWSWADAYERTGRRYYPKLVSSVPFTPATSRRLLVAAGADAAACGRRLVRGALEAAREADASSLHVLFPDTEERSAFRAEGLLERKGCQFHWHNDGYRDFDDFLARFSSAKRKKAKRERRRIEEAGIRFEHLHGNELSAPDWDAVFEFYARTFLRRGRAPYLNREFFERIAATMPESLMVVLARFENRPIATAICFRSSSTLYGRYWGSLADFHSLHFEACYYQGIEYCIREGLQSFEPGTQGEHKISRGFRPCATWSYHWLNEPDFHEAVEEFLTQETSHVDSYMAHLSEHVPYRRSAADDAAQ